MSIGKQGIDTVAKSAATLAKSARIEILNMTSLAKASHVASSLSVIDLLAVLYSGIANVTPDNHEKADRDIVILSKGHAAAAIYSVLALKKFFDSSWLDNYCGDGAQLGGHVTSTGVPGVELSTGSLGHGLPYGLGIAISRKLTKSPGNIFIIMSDGECDEGTTWESALIANQFKLGNLVALIDRNRQQSFGDTEETIALDPFDDKWRAFGWNVFEVDGHDHAQISDALLKAKENSNSKPTVVICNTTKGKGVSFMENEVVWHYRPPNDEQFNLALAELEALK